MFNTDTLIEILNSEPNSECQVELETLSDALVDIPTVARKTNRICREVKSIIDNTSSGLSLYTKWIVFEPKGEE